jgi:hypothetical protein
VNTVVKLIASQFAQAILRRYPGAEFILAFTAASINALYGDWKRLRAQLKTKDEVTPELKSLRMEACRSCPIFFTPLQTCGSPFIAAQQGSAPLGCSCHMPTKAATKSNCWYYDLHRDDFDESIHFGWPKSLNSFPHEHH